MADGGDKAGGSGTVVTAVTAELKSDEYASTVKFLKKIIPLKGTADEHISEIFAHLYEVYKTDLPKAEVRYWYRQLEDVNSSVNEIPENVKRGDPERWPFIDLHEKLARDPQLTQKKLKMWKQGDLDDMLNYNVYKHEMFSRLVPKELSKDDKNDRKKFCKNMQSMFKCEDEKNYIVACDEMYINFTETRKTVQSEEPGPSTKRMRTDDGTPVELKNQDDTMFVVFFDHTNVLYNGFVERDRLVSQYPEILREVSNTIKKKGYQKWYLLHNDTPLMRTVEARKTMSNEKIILLSLPWFSPDLSPCRFLYPPLKDILEDGHNDTKEELQSRLMNCANQIWYENYKQFIKKDLFDYFHDCITKEGDYIIKSGDFVKVAATVPEPKESLSKYIKKYTKIYDEVFKP